jgi:hypothetical protein
LISGVLACVRNYDLNSAAVESSLHMTVDSVFIETNRAEEITLLDEVDN